MEIPHRELLCMSASLPLMSITEGGEWRQKSAAFFYCCLVLLGWFFLLLLFWGFFIALSDNLRYFYLRLESLDATDSCSTFCFAPQR